MKSDPCSRESSVPKISRRLTSCTAVRPMIYRLRVSTVLESRLFYFVSHVISTHFNNLLQLLFLVLPGTGNPDPSREYIFFALFRFTSPPVRPCLGSFSSLPRPQFVLASAPFRPCLGSFSSLPRLLFVLASAAIRLCLTSCSSLHA